MSDELTVPTAADRAAHAALVRAAAGELLGPTDIAAIWRIGASRFHALNQAGAFDFLKVKPAVGPRCFSGVLVHRYVQGEPVLQQPGVFGGKRRQA